MSQPTALFASVFALAMGVSVTPPAITPSVVHRSPVNSAPTDKKDISLDDLFIAVFESA